MRFDEYLDIPFVARGRDKRGADCWGLVRIVGKEQFGFDLPMLISDYDVKSRRSCAKAVKKWQAYSGCSRVSGDPQPGDLVLMAYDGAESHVGICIAPGEIMHSEYPYGPRVQSLSNLVKTQSIVGVYRADNR